MLMVVFGAGASYGSRPETGPRARASPVEHVRPPLTDELLSGRHGTFAARYPSSRPAIVALRRARAEGPDTPIESAIGDLYEAAAHNPERARHLLALRFYLCDLVGTVSTEWWDRLDGFTHYTELLDRIGTWRLKTDEPVVLVTFNYDRLLDLTTEAQVGDWRLGGFPSYIGRSDWQLLKLHGSVGWARVLYDLENVDHNQANEVISRSGGVDFDRGDLRPRPWSQAIVPGERNAVAVPGIAVPTTLKQDFQCPKEHVETFKKAVGEVDRLLTVGWRAAEPHVLELLAQSIPPGYHLAICDRSEDDIHAIRDNLGLAARRSPEPQAFTGGFTGLLDADRLEQWLSLPAPGQSL
jgi:hypothetical protein